MSKIDEVVANTIAELQKERDRIDVLLRALQAQSGVTRQSAPAAHPAPKQVAFPAQRDQSAQSRKKRPLRDPQGPNKEASERMREIWERRKKR